MTFVLYVLLGVFIHVPDVSIIRTFSQGTAKSS